MTSEQLLDALKAQIQDLHDKYTPPIENIDQFIQKEQNVTSPPHEEAKSPRKRDAKYDQKFPSILKLAQQRPGTPHPIKPTTPIEESEEAPVNDEENEVY